jgi:type VI protein secretion system component VasF
MAQTRKKRRRKHRGTQAGTVEARGRTGRRPSGGEVKKPTVADRRAQRWENPPTWGGAAIRALLAAVAFAFLAVLLLDMPTASAAAVTPVIFLMYIPAGYAMDQFLYKRHQRRKAAEAGR